MLVFRLVESPVADGLSYPTVVTLKGSASGPATCPPPPPPPPLALLPRAAAAAAPLHPGCADMSSAPVISTKTSSSSPPSAPSSTSSMSRKLTIAAFVLDGPTCSTSMSTVYDTTFSHRMDTAVSLVLAKMDMVRPVPPALAAASCPRPSRHREK